MNNKKIGILTIPFSANYGNALQQFALLTYLKQLGYDAYSIYRKWDISKRRSVSYYIKRWVYYSILCRKPHRFICKYITPKTELINSQRSMKKVLDYQFDAIIVGSDQVWRIENTKGAGNNYFLDFISSNDTIKISYAASFGADSWSGSIEKTAEIKKLLEDFSLVSVREEGGTAICSKYFGISAECVLDPTLLLDVEVYKKIIGKNTIKFRKQTLVTYILDHSDEKQKIINQIADNKHYSIYSLYKNSKYQIYRSVQDFLAGLYNASFIVTDSYHGMIFSIIFNKPFLVIGNAKRGLARFQSLLNILGLQKRMILDYDYHGVEQIISADIDYSAVSILLKQEVIRSTKFLRKGLDLIKKEHL
jgi:hypothetical protein